MVRTSGHARQALTLAGRRRRRSGVQLSPGPPIFKTRRSIESAVLNRNLLLFSIFLIVLGVGFGVYLLAFFGVLLLIPALMAPSRPVPRPSAPTRQEPRRITPPTRPRPMVIPPQPMMTPSQPETISQVSAMMPATPQPSSSTSYSPALFPNSMFPSLSLSGTPQPRPVDSMARKGSERDELIEAGALLALFKLFFR